MGRTIIKMTAKHQENLELKEAIRQSFSPMLGTPTRGRNSVVGRYYEQGEMLATVYAEDYAGIRRSWKVTVFETAGSMRVIWGHGRWTLMYASNQTVAGKAAERKWLESCQ